MNNFADIIDKLFQDLIDLKRMHRTDDIRGSFQTAAKNEVNRHLGEIDIETNIPQS
tara:strand:+ start:527 stop:694 length:168 start_codon:yes stop_codon:yes gene_type:complete